MYTYPCDATLGDISLGFGSKKYAINAKDFNLGPVSEYVLMALSNPTSALMPSLAGDLRTVLRVSSDRTSLAPVIPLLVMNG